MVVIAPYAARFGQPTPGQKVFLVTCQEQNGWKDQDQVLSAIVPPPSPIPLPHSKTLARLGRLAGAMEAPMNA